MFIGFWNQPIKGMGRQKKKRGLSPSSYTIFITNYVEWAVVPTGYSVAVVAIAIDRMV